MLLSGTAAVLISFETKCDCKEKNDSILSAEKFPNLAEAFIQSVLIHNVSPRELMYSRVAMGLSTVYITLLVYSYEDFRDSLQVFMRESMNQ